MLQEEVLEMPQMVQVSARTSDLVGNDLPGDSTLNPDYLGMSGSFLCLLHCIAPQLLMLGSVGLGLSTFFESESWNLFFWATCFWAVWSAGKQSVFIGMLISLWVAFAIFTFGLGYEILTGSHHFISYIGSVSLIVAHTLNLIKQNHWKNWLKTNKVVAGR